MELACCCWERDKQLPPGLAKQLTELGAEVELRQHAPSFEPCQVRLTFDDCEIVVQHRWPVANLKTDITLEDRCIVPFTTTARSDSRGDLLARAASMVEEHVRR